MEEQFGQAKEKRKRILFLESMIRERNEEISSLEAEVASLRKKNGRAVKAEVDILIYQINKKIDALEKSVEECKEEIKRNKGEIADLLSLCYAQAENERETEKVEELMNDTFGGKLRLVSCREAGGIFGKCTVVSAVTTNSKKNRLKISRMLKAGTVTDAGKYVTQPEIEVYDYVRKGLPGVRREETDEFKKKLEKKRHGEGYYYLEELFSDGKGVLFALLAAALLVAASYAARYVGFDGTHDGVLLPCASAVACFILPFSVLFSAKRGGKADLFALFAVVCGIGLFALRFVFPRPEYSPGRIASRFILPAGLFLAGVSFGFCRFRTRKVYRPKDGDGISYLSAAVAGGLSAAYLLSFGKYACGQSYHSGYTVYLAFLIAGIACAGVVVAVCAVRLFTGKKVGGEGLLFYDFFAGSLLFGGVTETPYFPLLVVASSACSLGFVIVRLWRRK